MMLVKNMSHGITHNTIILLKIDIVNFKKPL